MKANRKLFILSIVLFGTIFSSNLMAQEVNQANNVVNLGLPELALLGTTSEPIDLVLTTTAAGQAVASSATNSSSRVQISSIVAGEELRSISAKISTGVLPANTYLNLDPEPPTLTINGTAGVTGAEIVLDGTDKTVVTGIGSCYSGIQATNGYTMKYTFGLSDLEAGYANLKATGAAVGITVTFTLSE